MDHEPVETGMQPPWEEFDSWIDTAVAVQTAMLQALDDKLAAVRGLKLPELDRVIEAESRLAVQLDRLAKWRLILLEKFRQSGLARSTLRDCGREAPLDVRAARLAAIDRIEADAERIRNATCVAWIAVNRCKAYYDDIVERLAAGGQESPTYDDRASPHRSRVGGAVLDAAA